jgi:hypothetical protein
MDVGGAPQQLGTALAYPSEAGASSLASLGLRALPCSGSARSG